MHSPLELRHETVAAALVQEIEDGTLPRGTVLPGEHALANRFGVSRTTVRAALQALQQSGRVVTRSGKGSYVTDPSDEGSFVEFQGRPLRGQLGWTRALAEHDARAQTRLLRLEVIEDVALATDLGLPSSQFVAIDRLRLIGNDEPISFERSRIPAVESLLDVSVRGLQQESLTETLRRVGLQAVRGEEWVQATALGEEEAQALGRSPGQIFLHARRISWTSDGAFVESVDSYLDPAYFQMHLKFGQGAN